jgi:uncharacterized membrane protein
MAQPHILVGTSTSLAGPAIRRIEPADLRDALAAGWDDFSAMPSHAIFLCVIYPIMGLVLAGLTLGYSVLPLLYPLAAGFALVGPFAAIGLYEMSRRREAGLPASIGDLHLMQLPQRAALLALAVVLMAIFVAWVAVAQAIYVADFGNQAPASEGAFLHDVLFTAAGWKLIVAGNIVGFLFAVVALAISVVSFPLLLDRDVGLAVAISTSVRAVLANPVTMGLWGLIVAVLLFIGSIPLFLGLTIVLPVLGHATWHLYRKVVEPEPGAERQYRPLPAGRRSAADFPLSLFMRTGKDEE